MYINDLMQVILSFFNQSQSNTSSLTDEQIEEFRMLSKFEPREIQRLHTIFLNASMNKDTLDKDDFLSINCISINPLKERIAKCFGYDEKKTSIDFTDFILGMAAFNSTGRREQKIKIAFKMQDINDDGQICKEDLKAYLTIVTGDGLSPNDMTELVNKVISEGASDGESGILTYSDFQRIVAKTDFQAKLHISI